MTANMNPKNLFILAALGIGAYLLTTRRAAAATLPQPVQGNKVPTIWRQAPTAAIQPQRPAGEQGVINAGLNLVSQLLGTNAPLVRSPNFNPGYFPDNMGEAAAQSNYWNNPDAFAVNPPQSFNPDPQLYASSGGYLDSQ
jgi:hypothetical protein